MDLKKKLKRFFTLTRKANDGFTLVELIVVIAILAILAGVGTVGYGGYVKNANKKADQVLVGEIERAIKIGNNSLVYELSEVLQPSEKGAQIPVGFIVLTTDSTGTTMESQSTQTLVGINKPCEIGTLTVYTKTYLANDKWQSGFISKTDHDEAVYSVTAETITDCCLTHSSCPTTNVRVWKSGNTGDANVKKEESENKAYALKENASIVKKDSSHVEGQFKSDEVYGSFYEAAVDGNGNYVTANNQGMLHEALVAAFGPNPDLTLKYDGWTDTSVPTFWQNATQIWGKVESLSNMMQTAVEKEILGVSLGDIMGINNHGSSEKTIYDVSVSVGNIYAGADGTAFGGKEAFVEKWASYGKATEAGTLHGGDNFGIGEPYVTADGGREYYSAMRGAYNNCFASYVRTHHSEPNRTSHADAMAGYGERGDVLLENKVEEKFGYKVMIPAALLGDMAKENFPRQICKDSFTTEDPKAQAYMGSAWGCTECSDLYDEYIRTGADKADAAAVFDTFQTAAGTDPKLLNGGFYDSEGNPVDFFDFYGKYLEEMDGLYSAATGLAGEGESCIVISVFYADGQMQCEVSPVEANPRK